MRLSSLGDIVNLTVIFSVLRNHYPNATIDFVIKEKFRPLVEPNNHNIGIIEFDEKTGFSGWISICRRLKAEKYDYFLDMHNNIRSRILSVFLWNTKKTHFVKPRLRRFLLFYFWINLFPKTYNLITEYLKTLTLLNIYVESGKTDIRLKESVEKTAHKKLKEKGIVGDFIALLPIAAWKNKRYNLSRFKELSQLIIKSHNLPVVWLGGKQDRYLDAIELKSENIIPVIGETSLMESMAILKQARIVIGNDTGLTYAAQALGTPALIIEGPTSRETGAGHVQYGSRVVKKDTWCRPCSQKGDRRCYRKKQYCLDIMPEEIFDTFNQVFMDTDI